MDKSIEFIKEIESNYKVETIKINQFCVWQLLRYTYSESCKNDKYSNTFKSNNNIDFFDCVNDYFKGTLICRKKFKYLLFTDELEERVIKNKISDKIAFPLLSIYKNDIAVILSKKYNDSSCQYYHKYYINDLKFTINKRINMSMKHKNKITITNEDILKEINQKYNLNIDYRKIIDDFIGYVNVYDKFFKRIKPKAIFVNCYYLQKHQATVLVAHKNNIKVIELQHGIINNEHVAYNIFKNIGNDSFPDYLFSFGEYVKKYISKNFINEKNIIPIGNFYIEYVKSDVECDKSTEEYFKELKKKYKKIVTITSQITIEDKLIEFVKCAAQKGSDIAFLFIPRIYSEKFKNIDLPQNFIINKQIDFYHSVYYSDYHSTVYSTCAIESLSYGVPDILINIDNLSIENYNNFLDGDAVKYANTVDEYLYILNSWDYNKDEINNIGNKYYKKDNIKNIKEALNKIV